MTDRICSGACTIASSIAFSRRAIRSPVVHERRCGVRLFEVQVVVQLGHVLRHPFLFAVRRRLPPVPQHEVRESLTCSLLILLGSARVRIKSRNASRAASQTQTAVRSPFG